VSARLILGPTAPEILIEGKGSGHGVGLNQRGAMILAADYQWDYRQILYHYYSKVTICRVHSGEETSMPVCGS
jgi:SpoIID/LytB domain protein